VSREGFLIFGGSVFNVNEVQAIFLRPVDQPAEDRVVVCLRNGRDYVIQGADAEAARSWFAEAEMAAAAGAGADLIRREPGRSPRAD